MVKRILMLIGLLAVIYFVTGCNMPLIIAIIRIALLLIIVPTIFFWDDCPILVVWLIELLFLNFISLFVPV